MNKFFEFIEKYLGVAIITSMLTPLIFIVIINGLFKFSFRRYTYTTLGNLGIATRAVAN